MRQPKDKGFAGLVAILVCCAVLLILASVMIPSLVEAKRVSTEVAAAAELNQIGTMEKTYSQYGAYVNPQFLTGTLPTPSVPLSCSNSFLMTAGQVEQPDGYTMNFVGTPTTFNCPGIAAGYSAYSITLVPTNSLFAQRSFFADQTGVVRFNDDGTATAASPAYSITSSNGVMTVGNPSNPQTGTGNNSLVTIWSATPSQNYVQGSEVLRSAVASGVACGSSNGPLYYGVYVNLTGSNGDPCTDAADWFYSGIGTAPSPVVITPPPTSLSGSISFTSIGAQSLTGGDNFFPANVAQSSWPTLALNTLNFTVSGPPPTDGYLRAQIIDQTTGMDAPAWCNLNNATSCTSQNTLTVNHGDVLAVRLNWFQCSACSNYSITSISWTLTP
jgi:Tfp pilus assembly protein PilE